MRSQAEVARFIGRYEALCREFGLMVVMANKGGYSCFVVADVVGDPIRDQIAQACEEMRLSDVLTMGPEPK